MGVDIHLLTEIKKNNVWEPIEEYPMCYDGRNYDLFKILDENSKRGIPEELKGKKFGYTEEYGEKYWRFDFTADWLYGHSYITLEKLNKAINKLNKVTVSEEFLEIFFELGGVLPKGLTLDPSDNGIYVESQDEYEEATRDTIITGALQLKEIAQKYNVSEDEIRLVFAYDC